METGNVRVWGATHNGVRGLAKGVDVNLSQDVPGQIRQAFGSSSVVVVQGEVRGSALHDLPAGVPAIVLPA